ncbi:unnamed protein product, partial [Anisakis simplex]|uniref:Secreted protein n=1 Tax=Anisakis simplex TaxID=6269 RepID=A0A0M3J9S8_ANISI
MVREKRCCARRYNLNVGVFSAALIHRSKSTDCIMARGLRRSARQRRSAENLCRRTDNGNDIGDNDSDNGQRQQQQQQ